MVKIKKRSRKVAELTVNFFRSVFSNGFFLEANSFKVNYVT